MKGPWSAERTFVIGLLTAITANEGRIMLKFFYYGYLAGFGQLTDMQFMVAWIGTKIVNVR